MDYSGIFKRDQFICQYCGRDGKKQFEVWLYLSADHLLPTGHFNRNNPAFIVTACSFCNRAASRYFMKCNNENIQLDPLTPAELMELRRPYIQEAENGYRQHWDQNVRHSQDMSSAGPLTESYT